MVVKCSLLYAKPPNLLDNHHLALNYPKLGVEQRFLAQRSYSVPTAKVLNINKGHLCRRLAIVRALIHAAGDPRIEWNCPATDFSRNHLWQPVTLMASSQGQKRHQRTDSSPVLIVELDFRLFTSRAASVDVTDAQRQPVSDADNHRLSTRVSTQPPHHLTSQLRPPTSRPTISDHNIHAPRTLSMMQRMRAESLHRSLTPTM
jgi:hypothetical protein